MLAGKLEQKEDLRVCEIPGEKNAYCLANKYCRDKDVDKKDFVSGHDILYYIDRENPRGPIPDKPDRDPQYKNWEKGVEDWYEKQKGVVVADAPDDECDADDFKKYLPSVNLSAPGSAPLSSTITLSANADAPYGIESVTYAVNGTAIGTSTSKSSSVSYAAPDSPTTLTVSVEIKDENGNKAKAEKSVAVQ